MLDAHQLKDALASSPGVLAIIASAWFYDEVVRHSPTSTFESYRKVQVSVKETQTSAWIYLPDHPILPSQSATNFVTAIEALESMPCMQDETARWLVIKQLRPAVAGAIRHYPNVERT